MTAFEPPVVAWRGATGPDDPLVVLLHGRGSDEADIIALADHLPDDLAYAAVRAPIAEGGGYAWFANRGSGRPVAESLTETMAWFRAWLDEVAPVGRPVVLVGFSGGAAFAGGLVLDDPGRYAGAAILYGTLPFDAGVPTTPGQLADLPVLVAHGDTDVVIPADLPLVTGEDLDAMVEALPGVPGVVVCPTADGGTGGLLRAPGGIVPPCYGPGSADAHVDAARRAGVPVRRLLLPGLALDLDRPSDIALAGGWRAVTAGSAGPGGAGDSETRPVERYPHR